MALLIKIIIVLVVTGVLLYCLNVLVTMDAKYKQIINVLVGLAVFLWLVFGTGLLNYLNL